MSDLSTAARADPKDIRETVAEIAAGCERSEQFFTKLFDDLDALLADLARQYDAWLDEGRSAGQEAEALREQIRGLEQQQAAWEQERTALENELEMVRGRTAELSESLAEQKQQMEAQQAEWTQELRQMRRLLEMMAKRQLDRQETAESRQPAACAAASAAPAALAAPEAPAAAGDPVLDSVVAQFEMLQKDLAQRRRSS